MRQYTTRKHKQRYLQLFELNSGENETESSVKSRTGAGVILSIGANGQVDTALPWIGNAGSRIRDRTRNGPSLGMSYWNC